MPDRRTVDELSIEELEEVLRIRKREARMARLRHYDEVGRRRSDMPLPTPDSPPTPFDGAHQAPKRKKRTLRDRLLLLVEFGAAVGLVAILAFTAWQIQSINRQAVAEQEAQVAEMEASMPTPSPTPILGAVVLPGGHTPPTAPGGAQPRFDEVPSHLQPLVQQQVFAPVIEATRQPGHAVRVEVPSISVDAPIVYGDGWEQLKQGVGQHVGTGNPGQNSGNVVLSAHNDIFGEIFRYLDQLQTGDEIIVHTSANESFTYVVDHWRIVEPTEVSVLQPTTDPTVTLISCYPYLDNSQRIVVVAGLSD
ncbi:MAG: sortase [Chloroflexi bacterium]|nr:sortase [Chloroflexota bacterium]